MAILERFMERLTSNVHGTQDWPPRLTRDDWNLTSLYRYRFENDRARLVQNNPRWHGPAEDIFTPVPVAYEMARLSASLLFSEKIKKTSEGFQDELDELYDFARLDSLFQSSGEYVAVEGRAALKVVWDQEVQPDYPILAFVHGDQVLWDIRHGHYVMGGAVVTERGGEKPGEAVYRLIEEHGKGYVSRALYKGSGTRLGSSVPLGTLDEFDGLKEEESTGLSVPTLIPWENVPGGRSDLYPVMGLLDTLDEAESLLLDKGRKSVPVVFGDRTLADEQGRVQRTGIILTGGGALAAEMGEEGKGSRIETVQPGLQSSDHIAWIMHVLERITEGAGYSPATWGRDAAGGQADSGKALKLRQSRTLINRAGKERMCLQSIAQALSIALAWRDNPNGNDTKIHDYLPEIVLGDGLPSDSLEDATEIQTLKSAEAISTEQMVTRLHPDWTDEQIKAEVGAIEGASQKAAAQNPLNRVLGPPGGLPGGDDERER